MMTYLSDRITVDIKQCGGASVCARDAHKGFGCARPLFGRIDFERDGSSSIFMGNGKKRVVFLRDSCP